MSVILSILHLYTLVLYKQHLYTLAGKIIKETTKRHYTEFRFQNILNSLIWLSIFFCCHFIFYLLSYFHSFRTFITFVLLHTFHAFISGNQSDYTYRVWAVDVKFLSSHQRHFLILRSKTDYHCRETSCLYFRGF